MARKVLVWIACGDRVLLLRRARSTSVAGWHPVTGNVDAGEDLAAAAAREVLEETGLAVTPIDLGLTTEFERYGERRVEHAFAARADRDPTLSTEHDAFEWTTVEEADARVAFAFQKDSLRAAARALSLRTR